KSPKETYQMMQNAYGSDCLGRTQLFEWYSRFKNGRRTLEDVPRKGRPSTSRTYENLERVRMLLVKDRRMTCEMLSEELKISTPIPPFTRIDRSAPEWYQSGQFFLLHDNVPSYTSITVSSFSAKKSVTVLTHPLYSPDLAPADYFLFPKPKSDVKGTRFEDVIAIKSKVTTIFKGIPGDEFFRCFQRLYERNQERVNRAGDYIKR
ncbi:Putative uncharacterized protein FLJ37770, partial [Habropoda laboriosa]